MTEKNLIPLKPKGDIRSDKIRAKLKGSSSDKRKIAQKISGLKRTKPKNVGKKALQLATDPKVSSLEIMRMIQVLYERWDDLETGEQMQLIRVLNDAYRTIFGSKAYNVNLNLKRPDSAESMREIWLTVQNERKTDTKKSNKEKGRKVSV